MSSPGDYFLNWSHHQDNRTSAFNISRETQQFVDVTLACDDDEQLEAHKIILSASSPFFQNILQRNNHSHPLLYIRGSSKKNMSALLDFMYSGEVTVPQDELEKLMMLARDLKVRGLCDDVPFNKELALDEDIKADNDDRERETANCIIKQENILDQIESDSMVSKYDEGQTTPFMKRREMQIFK